MCIKSIKNPFLYLLSICTLLCMQSNRMFAQNIVEDKELTEIIKNSPNYVQNNTVYYILLNPNAKCTPCFVSHYKKILNDKTLLNKIGIITTNDIIKELVNYYPSPVKPNFLIVNRNVYGKLTYFRYRNSLIKFDNNQLKILMKLTTQTTDSLCHKISG